MKKIVTIILILIINISSISAQKYTDLYIEEANEIGLNWLNDINNNRYEKAYNLLAKEGKLKYQKETWIELISELMLEFGIISQSDRSRTVINKFFKSEIEGMEDGFYVFIEYKSNYLNTNEHIEYLLLKQNSKRKWEILDYSYEFTGKN